MTLLLPQQLTHAMAAAGVDFDLAQRDRIGRVQYGAAPVPEAGVNSGAAAYCTAPYLVEARERHLSLALTELRTGVHWGAESQDR